MKYLEREFPFDGCFTMTGWLCPLTFEITSSSCSSLKTSPEESDSTISVVFLYVWDWNLIVLSSLLVVSTTVSMFSEAWFEVNTKISSRILSFVWGMFFWLLVIVDGHFVPSEPHELILKSRKNTFYLNYNVYLNVGT